MDDPYDKVLMDHPLARAVTVRAETPLGPRPFLRLQMGDWVNVVAVTRDDDLVLVRQHRWGVDASTLEVPGGLVDPGEDPAQAALRELREETGYAGGTLLELGWAWPNPAIQDNRLWLFAVEGVTRVGAPEPDGTEDITVELHPVADLLARMADGTIRHALALLTLQRYLLRRQASR